MFVVVLLGDGGDHREKGEGNELDHWIFDRDQSIGW